LQLHGAGADWPNIRTTVTGQGDFRVQKATLATNLPARFADAFVQVVEGLEMHPNALPKIDKTQLGDLRANVVVQDGWLRLASPLDLQTPFGALHLNGRVGLDRALDLTGTVDLDPKWVQTLSAGRLVPRTAVNIPLVVKGTASEPQFQVTMAAAEVAKQLVIAGALPKGLPNIGGGPPQLPQAPPQLPQAPPSLPHLPSLPKIPGVPAPSHGDGGAPPQ
jgi:AsmA-like C-terminal region